MDESLIPDFETEKQRYLSHNNDIEDIHYQQFVSPIVEAVLGDFPPDNKGLDFGAGTGPVISKMLTDKNYDIKLYDPFFHNYPLLLEEHFDYIVCCEVIEHFHQPLKEFQLLKKILNRPGVLYCMTSLYHPGINFHSWFYKNDLTHVFIYQEETLEWIQHEIGFTKLMLNKNLIKFIL